MESIKGISLHYYKYSESSVIAKIFTENYGLQSYVIKGIRNKTSKNKLSYLHPLNIVSLEISVNKNKGLPFVKEIRSEHNLSSTYSDMQKKFVCMFISEVLMRVLMEKETDKKLYNFAEKTIFYLNKTEELNKNFVLVFLLKLTEFLGFHPNKDFSNKDYFDLESGEFTNHPPYYNIRGENKKYLSALLQNESVDIPYKNRKKLIVSLQKYFSLHHYNIEKLKSYEVIESLRT